MAAHPESSEREDSRLVSLSAAELMELLAVIEQTRLDMNARLDKLTRDLRALLPATPAPSPPPAVAWPVRVGDSVRVPRLGGVFPVVEVAPSGDTFTVQTGTMRVRVRRDEAEAAAGAPGETFRGLAGPRRVELEGAIPEIDLHGFSERDALVTLDMFLHHCFVGRTLRVRVIHGKGTGVLRAAVRRALSGHPLVRGIDTGPHYEGNDGVTLVELDV